MRQQLPSTILAKATRSGEEYAWPLSDVEDTIEAARICGLANLGGQPQFRSPNGIYELWWLVFDSQDRLPEESWDSYVERSATEVKSRFATICERSNFIQEGLSSFDSLKQLHDQGNDLRQWLCFPLYFDAILRDS